jgi:hypothetical protein
MSIELTWWTKHYKSIVVGLAMLDREVATFYLELMIEVCLMNWFPIIDDDTFVDSPKA